MYEECKFIFIQKSKHDFTCAHVCLCVQLCTDVGKDAKVCTAEKCHPNVSFGWRLKNQAEVQNSVWSEN